MPTAKTARTNEDNNSKDDKDVDNTKTQEEEHCQRKIRRVCV